MRSFALIILSFCVLSLHQTPVNGQTPCFAIKNETSCINECIWCDGFEACSAVVLGCPNAPTGGGDDDNNTNGTQSCYQLQNETTCMAEGCSWCAGVEYCRQNITLCPPPSPGPSAKCVAIQTESDCVEDCLWCPEANVCSSSDFGCPGGGGGGPSNDDDTCLAKQEEDICVDDCVWCSSIGICSTVDRGCPSDVNGAFCNPLTNNLTDCLSNGCFVCNDEALCRASEDKCPGLVGNFNRLCKSLDSETECSDAGCKFCIQQQICRASDAECPGNGRIQPCRDQSETECSASDMCLWCEESSVCTGARGYFCPLAAGNGTDAGKGNSCFEFTEEDPCTSGSTSCRWCPGEAKCKKANAGCADGSAGIRRNPCKEATSEGGCFSVAGCLWCEENSKCKKVTDGCEEEYDDTLCRVNNSTEICSSADNCLWCNSTSKCRNGNIGCDVDDVIIQNILCKRLEYQVDCEGQRVDCQWCPDQEKCKRVGADCGLASAELDLEVDYDGAARFALRNAGLGITDPNQVSVKIDYLFEIGDDGETEIESSFIDLENQDFNVEQVESTFLGGILARWISFDASIDGVGDIELEVFFMLEDGPMTTPAGEVYDISEGDIKFNLNMFNWTFCGSESNPCGNGNESSRYIDVAAEITGSASIPEEDDSNGLVFNLGGDVPLILSNQIEVDGVTDAMPVGFPRVETSEQGTVFVFRFPRFESTVEYDPIVQTDGLITITPPPTSPPSGLPSVSPSDPPSTSTSPTDAQSMATMPPTLPPQSVPASGGSSPSADSGSGLSDGAIIGIAFAIVILLAIGAIYRLLECGERSRKDEDTDFDRTRDIFPDEDLNLSGGV